MAKKILLIGSGPIVIGQGMEFDYSACEAIKAYHDEGYQVHVLNSNPASLMLDLADKAFILPINPENVLKLLEEEEYVGIAHGFGGQTALNLALDLSEDPRFIEKEISFLGSDIGAVKQAEDREKFKELVQSLGYDVPFSWVLKEGDSLPSNLRLPLIIRPAYTLGGKGGGRAETVEKLSQILPQAFDASPIKQCLLEEDLSGQTELEFEIVVDKTGDTRCILSIENIDPVGIHTGDSMVVAPIQSLSAKKIEELEKLSQEIALKCGVVGSCNVQLAYDREKDRASVIEMNPRVSRSSALASKITHYPIAYVAAKLSLGKSLKEIKHPILKDPTTLKQNSFYPAFKAPLWPFDLMPEAQRNLGTQMKSLGEALGISNHLEGAIFQVYHAYPKQDFSMYDNETLLETISKPSDRRFLVMMELLKRNVDIENIAKESQMLPYFLHKMKASLSFSLDDFYFASSDQSGRMIPMNWKILPKKEEKKRKRLLFIAPGPCKIGQGIEFDYALMKAVIHARKKGYECFILNNNPASISTDDALADKVFMAAITPENVQRIHEMYSIDAVVLQFGGQTALNMLEELESKGFEILGTDFQSSNMAESRDAFVNVLKDEHLAYVKSYTACNVKEALELEEKIQYPVILRPSYVLAGKDMYLVNDHQTYRQKVKANKHYPLLIEKYISGREYDFDAVFDGQNLYHVGPVEHIEASGVHSGDASLLYPSLHLSKKTQSQIEEIAYRLAKRMHIRGFMNMQMIVSDDGIYVIEVNPRVSRTLPFLDRASKQSLIEIGMDVLLNEKPQKIRRETPSEYTLKLSSFSFEKLEGVDLQLGPSMKSTGEWMIQNKDLDQLWHEAYHHQGVDFKRRRLLLIMEDDANLDKQKERWEKIGYPVTAISSNKVDTQKVIEQLKTTSYLFTYIEGVQHKQLRRFAFEHKQVLFYRLEMVDILFNLIRKKVEK